MDTEAAPTITEVDGVRVLWAPAPGPLRGGLVFRTGAADETCVDRGINHLVEHLALAALGTPAHQMNGAVELVRTTFVTMGTPDEVTGFFRRVSMLLADLLTDRLPTEVNILRTEAAGRGTWPAGPALVYRFGAVAHGLSGQAEYVLNRVTPELVKQWARFRFNKANAVLWLTGPPPPDLRLALPDGPFHPLPTAAPLPVDYPAWVHQDGPGVAVSMMLPRGTRSAVFLRLLNTKALDHLRFTHGLSYAVAANGEALDPEQVHALAAADALPEHAAAVHQGLIATLRTLADDGPSRDDLRHDREQFTTYALAPEAVPAWLDGEATRLLFEGKVKSRAELAEQLAEVGGEAVRNMAARALASSLSLVPSNVTVEDEAIAPYPLWHHVRLGEREVFPASEGWGADSSRPERLWIGPDGISLTFGGDRLLSVRFADAVGLLQWTDGSRVVVGRDGVRIAVRPHQWALGPSVVREIDERVDPSLVVPMGEAADRPAAAAAGYDPPKPLKAPRRTSWGQRIAFAAFILIAALTAITIPVVIFDDDPDIHGQWGVIVFYLVVTGGLFGLWWALRQRNRRGY